jgi:hypothetical protein
MLTKAGQVELVARILKARFVNLPVEDAVDIALEIVEELEKTDA